MPRPDGFDYQRYLASREWALKREAVRERSGSRCEHCFRGPQQAVHHLTYERIGREQMTDLMAVCNPCHEWLSGKIEYNPLNQWAIVSESWNHHHLIIPLVSMDIPFEVECRESGCLWCGYIYPNWGHWFHNWWLRQYLGRQEEARGILTGFLG